MSNSIGTTLVNSNTPEDHPDNQQPTSYTVTPVEVQAYMRGEPLDAADMDVVAAHAAKLGVTVQSLGLSVSAPPAQTQARVVRRKKDIHGAPLCDIAQALVKHLTEQEKEYLFSVLCTELGFEVH